MDAGANEPSRLDATLNAADVAALFEAVLRRPVGNNDYVRQLVDSGQTVRALLMQLRDCKELRERVRGELVVADRGVRWDPKYFRAPRNLEFAEPSVRRILIVGSCLMHTWSTRFAHLATPVESDLYLIGTDLPDAPRQPIADYDFQLVQLPLRFVLPDGQFVRLDQADAAGHDALFARCVDMLRHLLDPAMRWNRAHGILTFVMPFIVPQQNPVGRLLPRYDLRNPVHFVERLNEAMAAELRGYASTYFFDLNEVLSTHGRRFVQEDMMALFNHGAFLSTFDYDQDAGRLDPVRSAVDVYGEDHQASVEAAWTELVAMWRTVRQTDAVKMVVIDLDDTLWRGTIAERPVAELPTAEGWPRGFWEALGFLKRRGILLAIISNNDEARVLEVWDHILQGQLSLDDFAIRRIDFRPKPERMAEILASVNLLARNVLFIDDNPVQRAEMLAAFPEIRVLGGDPFTWRHILLWSAETQTAGVSAESGTRTQMVQAQVRREDQRQRQPRAEFLAGLQVRMHAFRVDRGATVRFARALELINKTNQFNTTGQRWTEAELVAAMGAGLRIHAFNLADIYTRYGLVGALLVDRTGIRQFVMSCRVMGLEAEIAAVSYVAGLFAHQGRPAIEAAMVETSRNLPCRALYERCGFTPIDGGWRRATSPPLAFPAHIALTAPPLGPPS